MSSESFYKELLLNARSLPLTKVNVPTCVAGVVGHDVAALA